MKNLLLSLAVVAFGANVMNATDYIVYSAPEGSAWTTDAANKGFTKTVTVDGKSFTLATAQAASTTALRDPGTESYSMRVYKYSTLTITSADVDMKSIVLVADGTSYAKECTLSDGWTGTLDGTTYTLTNEAGAKTMTLTASNAQVRYSKITVSDEVGGGTTPDDPEPPTSTTVNSVKEAIALGAKTNVTVNFSMTVGFVNNNNIFCYDAAGDWIQIYGSNSYESGSVIPAGWTGYYELYNNVTPEFGLNSGETLPASTEKAEFTPKAVAPADITTALVNNVVLVKNVVLTEASPAEKANFTAKADGVELSFRNNYTLPSVEAGTYDITVVVTIYQNAPSLYVVNYGVAGGNSVTEIEAEAGEAVYFNLQGVKVANPEKGLYIKVEGNKATKVIL